MFNNFDIKSHIFVAFFLLWLKLTNDFSAIILEKEAIENKFNEI